MYNTREKKKVFFFLKILFIIKLCFLPLLVTKQKTSKLSRNRMKLLALSANADPSQTSRLFSRSK